MKSTAIAEATEAMYLEQKVQLETPVSQDVVVTLWSSVAEPSAPMMVLLTPRERLSGASISFIPGFEK